MKMQLIDLPELLLVHICKFFLDRFDYSEYGLYNGREGANSCYRYVLNYQLVNNQFKTIVHMTTRDDAYIGLCQYMYLNTIIPNISFLAGSNPFEDYEVGDLVVFDISPHDDSWYSSHNQNRGPLLCTREDFEGIAKILTLSKKYALGKIRLSSGYMERWLPSVIELLAFMVEENPEISINTEIIEIGWCGYSWDEPNHGFWHPKSWEGDNYRDDFHYHYAIETGENCIKAITTFVNLVKQLSSNNCKFANGISCIQCSAIHLYRKIPFTADMNKDSCCYYCKTPIFPNFKCRDCINYCHCKDYDGNYERDRCKGFCCSDCEVSKEINRQTWRLPDCQHEDDEEHQVPDTRIIIMR